MLSRLMLDKEKILNAIINEDFYIHLL